MELWDAAEYEDAVQCFRRAVAIDSDHRASLYMLGVAYFFGEEIERNDFGALAYLFRAAKLDYADEEFLLGELCEDGRLVGQDHSKAAAWYFLAAEHEHGLAAFRLAHFYEIGRGIIGTATTPLHTTASLPNAE